MSCISLNHEQKLGKSYRIGLAPRKVHIVSCYKFILIVKNFVVVWISTSLFKSNLMFYTMLAKITKITSTTKNSTLCVCGRRIDFLNTDIKIEEDTGDMNKQWREPFCQIQKWPENWPQFCPRLLKTIDLPVTIRSLHLCRCRCRRWLRCRWRERCR